MTIVTLDVISTMVLNSASGTSRIVAPNGHSVAPTLRSTYEENRPPNSMTSDARKSQIPSLTLLSPVSGRASTVYGISIIYTLVGLTSVVGAGG